jgi:VWFA-related protein
MRRLLFRLIAVAIVSSIIVSAQDADFKLKIDVPFVSVDVTAQDANGKPVNNLSEGAFELYENGVKQEILNFLPVSTPYDTLLLFDRSGSTQDKWLLMQRAVGQFIANLRPQDRIEIATFDYDVDVQLPWSNDRKRSLLVLPELLRPSRIGGTEFFKSLEQTLRREFRRASARRAMVVLTDGRDTSLYTEVVKKNRILEPKDDRPFQNALKAAATQRVPLYFVAFNTDKNFEPNKIGADEYRSIQQLFSKSAVADRYLEGVRIRMEQLADASGGRMLYPQRFEDVVGLYGEIGTELGLSYTLGYAPTNAVQDGSFRKIEVRTGESGLRLTQSRSGYYAR